MKINRTCLLFCLLFCLSGCVGERVSQVFKSAIQNDVMLLLNTYIYYAKNDKWPNSIEELKNFCSKNQEDCAQINWDKFTSVNFQTLPDGKLKLEATQSQEQGKFSFNTVLDVPKQDQTQKTESCR